MTCGKHEKDCLMECVNTHAPLRYIGVSGKKSPWIIDNLRHKMRKRDLLKGNRPRLMMPYPGNATNAPEIILTMILEKLKYFNDNLDRNKQNAKATWKLINSRKLGKLRSVPDIKIGEQIVTNTA